MFQAQGFVQIMGGADVVQTAVQQHNIVLAAHGPYTAAGAGAVLGCNVPCVSQNFSSFAGLVLALENEVADRNRFAR